MKEKKKEKDISRDGKTKRNRKTKSKTT